MRTILVLLIGAVLALLLFIVADLSLGTGIGPMGMNPNFSAVIGAWRALGGNAGDVGGSGGGMGGVRDMSGTGEMSDGGASPFGMAGGAPPFAGGGFGGARRGHRSTGFGEGIDVDKALGQFGSDLIWLGIPALIGAAIEIDAWYMRRKRRRAAQKTAPKPA